jgi:hypothetical protein
MSSIAAKIICSFILLITSSSYLYAQKQANQWVVSPNAIIDFNGPTPGLIPNSTNAVWFFESNATICDKNGNLLFYTDGDTIRNSLNQILPNGGDNLSFINSSIGSGLATVTQGTMICSIPNSDSLYYVFSLGFYDPPFNGLLSYSIVKHSISSGIDAVIESSKQLLLDTLSEKMILAKHCNNSDYWLTVVKYKNMSLTIDSGPTHNYSLEFLSFLVTENGVSTFPVRSLITDIRCAFWGQMKLNNAQNEIAFANNNEVYLFDFDNSTGRVKNKKQYSDNFVNGYGIEYAPNDSLLYIGSKQLNLVTSQLTSLSNPFYFSQLQRATNGKIYGIKMDSNECFPFLNPTDFFWDFNAFTLYSNFDQVINYSCVENPNSQGINCNFNPSSISRITPYYFNIKCLPYFPSYIFNQKVSDFNYTGNCINDEIEFSLKENQSVDSVSWFFDDSETVSWGNTVSHIFNNDGTWSVTCTVYNNDTIYSSTQCVEICGESSIILPSRINLCEIEPFELNLTNTCTTNYLWNTGDTTPVLFIDTPGIYILENTNNCGTYYDTLEVYKSEECDVQITIPNVFTPNESGENDLFSIQLKNAKSFQYTILNRWGGKVLEGEFIIPSNNTLSQNTLNIWDGLDYQGNQVNEGVYFLVLDITSVNDELLQETGFISLFR